MARGRGKSVQLVASSSPTNFYKFKNYKLILLYFIHSSLLLGGETASGRLHFYLMWLAIGNCLWKFIIYITLDDDFRKGVKFILGILTCKEQLPEPYHA